MFDCKNTPPEIKKKLACAEDTSVEVLQQLSKDSDREIRSLVASNPNTPTEILLKLGKQFPEAVIDNPIFGLLLLENPGSYFVRISLARSLKTAIATLNKLAKDEDKLLRASVANNRITPSDLLEKLASDSDESVRLKVATNPNTSSKSLEKLAADGDLTIRNAVMEHPNVSPLAIAIVKFINKKKGKIPIEALEFLANNPDKNIRQQVARHPNSSAKVLMKLAKDEDEFVRADVAANINTSLALLEQLASDRQLSVRAATAKALTKHSHVSLETFEHLIIYGDYKACIIVAQNPKTPSVILEKFARNRHKDIRDAVIKNPNASSVAIAIAQLMNGNLDTDIEASFLDELSYYKDEYMRQQVARHPNTPSETLDRLIDELNKDRYYTNYQFDELAYNRGTLICLAVAQNPNASSEVLSVLASDVDEEVRLVVANNPHTPLEVLEMLR
jgi:uncharacterized membrane-anchored protein YhcB (DUF1043 family)